MAFASRELKGGEPKYHSSKLEFLALKWAVTEQFWEYLQYQPFTVHTDNNLLMYILTTPNLDALGHCWVAALAGYNMKLVYLKGSDNKVADALSHAPEKLDEETVTELLNCTSNGNTPRTEADNIHIIEEGECLDQKVIVRATQIVKQHKKFHNLANSDWVEAQLRAPAIRHMIDWINQPKGDKRTLAEYLDGLVCDYDKHFYTTRQNEFIVQDNLLYIWATPANSQDLMPVFVVPLGRWQTAIDSCHHSTGHQGRD